MCICRIWIVSNVLNVINNTIGLPETTYGRVSFRTHNHYDCCTEEAENSPSPNWIYGAAKNLVMKQLTTSLYLENDSAMLHPLKWSENHSSKLTRAESMKARKRFLMIMMINWDQNSTSTSTICGDACPLSCASAEAYKLAQCTRPQGWGS